MAERLSEVEIKGVALRGLLSVLEDQVGAGFRSELRSQLDPEHARLLEGPVLAATWYPVALYREVHSIAQRQLSRGPDFARALAKEQVSRDFDGVYRVITGTLKPEWLMSFAPRQFKRYCRGGVAVVEEARSGYARWRLTDCTGFDKNMWNDVIGSCEAILEVCGATHVRARIAKGGGGLAHATIEYFWL